MMRLPALAGRSFMRRWPRLIISIVLCAVFFILFLSPRVYAQTVNQTSPNYITPNTAENVPPNLHNWVQTLMIDTMSALSCQLSGIDPTNPSAQCLGVDQKTGKIGFVENGGGLVGVLSYGIASLYNLPIGTSDYVGYIAKNFKPVGKSYAQATLPNYCSQQKLEPGICGLKPFIPIWAAARDIVYMLFVIIFIIIGLAIMFRVHIDPRTVMTVQNQIPKIIAGIILVTFSFAIAGLLIDVMYVVIYLFYNVLSGINIPSVDVAGSVSNLNPLYLQNQNTFSAIGGLGGLTKTADGIARALADVVRSFIGITPSTFLGSFVFISAIGRLGSIFVPNSASSAFDKIIDMVSIMAGITLAWQAGNFAANAAGVVIGSTIAGVGAAGITFPIVFGFVENLLRNWLPYFIVYIVVLIALIFVLVRLWFTLLLAYINILIDVIFAPFWLLAGLIPGEKGGFGIWFKDIVSNLAAFPVALGMLMIGQIFAVAIGTAETASKGSVFVPPLVGIPATETSVLGGLVGMGFIFMTPQVLTMVKKAIGAPQLDLGPIAPPLGAGIAAPLRIAKTASKIRGRMGQGKTLREAVTEEATGKVY